ncbi:hypothetical protein BpHYR1_015476, partial [Brachionus plicatilis]
YVFCLKISQYRFFIHFPPNTFHGVSNAVACDDKHRCLKIIEFSISSNHSLNCFDKYLPIIIGDSQIGFYPRDGGILFYHQKNSETCQKIKRFKINEEQVLIIIRETIAISDIKNVEETIEWLLFKNNEFACWLMFSFGLYDEEKNRIFYFVGLKDLVFIGACLLTVKSIYTKLCIIYICIKVLTEESRF